MEAASAVAQAIRSKVLSLGDFVQRRKASTKQEQKPFMGYVYHLPEKEQEALVECARLTVKELRDVDRVEHAALDEYHKERRKVNERDELDALFTQYALALSFFKRWQERGVERSSDINSGLAQFGQPQPRERGELVALLAGNRPRGQLPSAAQRVEEAKASVATARVEIMNLKETLSTERKEKAKLLDANRQRMLQKKMENLI
ncbi:hypothetical protein AB1Y20_009643 [Prymnesium parvum]|uniref:Uncharacterized protein n=1 Tax=Prymnesium parvum TaxID=97485 RepID=A0AB34K5R2_PRYPA